MYLALPKHTKHIIKDLYTVYLPPVPARNEIQGWELKKSDQFWKRTPLPEFYLERRDEEAYKQAQEKEMVDEGYLKKIEYFDDILERYRRQEWMRRIYGFWFMNNGTPTYLTGNHYMYLQWSQLDHPENDGYPLFYMPQLDRFYFRQLCYEDPFCLGYLIVGPRGFGKSSEETAVVLDNMTKPPHKRHAVIQSKSEDDAIDVVFKEKMVPMFNAYPDFFKPQYSHGTDPAKRMAFKRKAIQKGDKTNLKFGEDLELGNTIKCLSAKVKAADGKTLAEIISDEIGKTHPKLEADVYERHAVHVKCVFRNLNKRGLIRETTTVEAMDEGGDECYDIWLESNPEERDPNGYTASKIYKYLVTGMETQNNLADKFGNIPYDEAEKQIDNERVPFLGDPYKLSIVMRKNPKNEQEAFIKDQSKSMFNVFMINARISELEAGRKRGKANKLPGRQGRLEWVNEVDGDVEFIEDPTGFFTEYYTVDEYRNKTRKILNACTFIIDDDGNKVWMPVNNDLLRGGGDPIKFVKTDDPRASKFAGFGFLMFDHDLDHGKDDTMDWLSYQELWCYHGRSEDPVDDYENIIKALRYWGHSFMPENNVSDFTKHLYGRKYQKFIIVRKNFDASILMQKSTKNSMGADQAVMSNTEVIDSYVSQIRRWVGKHVKRCNNLALLKQLLEFDSKKPTKYDLVVGWGYTLLSIKAELEDYNLTQKQEEILNTLFRTYDIRGDRSRELPSSSQESSDSDDDSENDFDNPEYLQGILNRM